MQVHTIGIDLAKNVFQVHGVNEQHEVVLVRQLRRKKMIGFFSKVAPCLIGMEACATCHHWARELTKLGHTVRLIPPIYVKAYVKRQKNDAADAAAICEAVTRPTMRFVPIKTEEQQAALAVHRTRNLLIRQRTQLINSLRAHLAELGIVADQGREGLAKLVAIISEASSTQSLPSEMLQALDVMLAQLASLQLQIGELDRCIQAQHRASDVSRRLESIPGIGVIGATAIAATVTDPSQFKSASQFKMGPGRVGRPCAETELDRRQGAAGEHFKAGRQVSAASPRYRRHVRCEARPNFSREVSLDRETAGQEAGKGRGHRCREQAGTHRLGDHEQR